MKRIFVIFAVLVMFASGYAAMTNSSSAILTRIPDIMSQNPTLNPVYAFCNEVEDILEGTTAVTGMQLTSPIITTPVITANVEVFDSNDTLTAAETGKVCVGIGITGEAARTQIFTLPTASVGLTFTFVDVNAVAGDDLWITAAAGDTINGGTAAKSFKNTGDVVNASVTLIARSATDWVAMPSAIGTWANDNN